MRTILSWICRCDNRVRAFCYNLDEVMGIIVEWFQRKLRLFQKKREERRKRKEKEKRIAEARLSRDSRNIYWGPDGNLRSGFILNIFLRIKFCSEISISSLGNSIRNRDEELLDVLAVDFHNDDDNQKLWLN